MRLLKAQFVPRVDLAVGAYVGPNRTIIALYIANEPKADHSIVLLVRQVVANTDDPIGLHRRARNFEQFALTFFG